MSIRKEEWLRQYTTIEQAMAVADRMEAIHSATRTWSRLSANREP